MATYLVGTDGESASQAICDHLENELGEGDQVVGVYVSGSQDINEEAKRGLEIIEERLRGDVTVDTRRSISEAGSGPVVTLLNEIQEAAADVLVIGLRRHSRTERIMFGSVSHELIEKATIPILLVPLPEYQPPEA